MIRLDLSRAPAPSETTKRQATQALTTLLERTGVGSDFLGWLSLPSSIDAEKLAAVKSAATKLCTIAEVVVVVGIGGSYLGTKAVYNALTDSFDYLRKERVDPHIVYAGTNLSEDYMFELMRAVRGYSFAVIAVSKSGTTTEPAVAFRMLRREIERRYGEADARERIVVVTDPEYGSLRELSDKNGYTAFVIDDNIGGRYSVFSPAGLLPLAVAGVDIEAFVAGAADMERTLTKNTDYDSNMALRYAATRNELYGMGFKTEILGVYEPRLRYISEWWKQLYGESEGKEGKGIFPASVEYTADLHSMGQYIQQGERTLFETIISVRNSQHEVIVEREDDDSDGINYLAGMRMSEINRMAELGTAMAHEEGGVPNIRLTIDNIDAYNVGELLYMFEFACGISAYTLGVNPFDQPGVEDYKRNMFALLNKPGFENR